MLIWEDHLTPNAINLIYAESGALSRPALAELLQQARNVETSVIDDGE